MTQINKKTTLPELAAKVCRSLKNQGIDAILTGGGAVTLYSQNEYQSGDLDFISRASQSDLEGALKGLGFRKKGRHFIHPHTEFIVEFPGSVIQIGNLYIDRWEKKKTRYGTIYILSPTHCVMDRLAAFYHWNDLQSLDQALMVAKKNKVNLKEIEKWSQGEGKIEKFGEFKEKLGGTHKP